MLSEQASAFQPMRLLVKLAAVSYAALLLRDVSVYASQMYRSYWLPEFLAVLKRRKGEVGGQPGAGGQAAGRVAGAMRQPGSGAVAQPPRRLTCGAELGGICVGAGQVVVERPVGPGALGGSRRVLWDQVRCVGGEPACMPGRAA